VAQTFERPCSELRRIGVLMAATDMEGRARIAAFRHRRLLRAHRQRPRPPPSSVMT
jgi:hypothetical protein